MSLTAKLASVFCECPLTAELEQARAELQKVRDELAVVRRGAGKPIEDSVQHRCWYQAHVLAQIHEAADTAAKCRAELAAERDRRYTMENVANTIHTELATELAKVRDELTEVREAKNAASSMCEASIQAAYEEGFDKGQDTMKAAVKIAEMSLAALRKRIRELVP